MKLFHSWRKKKEPQINNKKAQKQKEEPQKTSLKKPNQFTKNIDKWLSNKMVPFLQKIGNQRHLCSVRDSFASITPLIIAGALGVLINAIVFGGAGSNKISLLALIAKAAHTNWNWNASTFHWPTTGFEHASQIGGLLFGYINVATIGSLSIYIAFALPYFLAVSRKFKSPVLVGLGGIAAYLIAIMGQVSFFLDAKGLITAIIIGLAAGELFIWFGNMKKLEIRMPAGVPPAVGKSFAVFLPMVFTLTIVALFNIFFLAPAIASTDWTVNQYLQMKGNIPNNAWKPVPAFGNGGGYNDFIAWIKKNYPSLDFNKLVFTSGFNQNAFNTWLGQYGKGNVNNWLNAHNQYLTNNGWNLFGQYLATKFQGTFSNPVSWKDIVFKNTVFGNNELLISVRYNSKIIQSNAFGFGAAIYAFFTSWFIGFATGDGGLALAFLYVFMSGLFWWFGIHGTNILAGIFAPIWLIILGVNNTLITAGGSSGFIGSGTINSQLGIFATPFFDAFCFMGGSGATLGFIAMVLILSKRKALKQVSRYALPAGCFNINEPVIFGFPIVLNFNFLIPFLLAPISGLILGWLAIGPLGFVKVPYIAVPWTTPFFITGLLATGISPWAPVVAIVAFILATLIWIPFIFFDNKTYFHNLKTTDQVAYAEAVKYATNKAYRKEIALTWKKERAQEIAELKTLRAKNKKSLQEAKAAKKAAKAKKAWIKEKA